MQFKKKITYSIFASFAVLISSILAPIIPCRIAPLVPNPNYKWTFCTLNPDNVFQNLASIKEYFGYSTSITDTFFLVIFSTFFVSMLILHFFGKSKKE